MGADSKIQWTHHTFNHVLGCAKVHTGCLNCYAENEQAIVMRKGGRVNWGEVWQGGDRVVVADSTWAKPLTWARAAAKAGERHRVFCASLSDVLEAPSLPEKWPSTWGAEQREYAARAVHRIGYELDEARERLWNIIRKTAAMTSTGLTLHQYQKEYIQEGDPGLDWLLLTKRPENWRLVPEDVRPLVWLGTSVSDQKTADEWAPRLLEAAGFRVRFLSVEPLLGPVDLTRWFHRGHHPSWDGNSAVEPAPPRIDWVIAGGESGPRARPCNVEWVRSIVQQCREARVACFVKQFGADPREAYGRIWSTSMPFKDPKGGDWNEWPEDLRVREFPR
jgi:protein gp37